MDATIQKVHSRLKRSTYMKLYGIVTSPFVRHCRIALTQGGLDWELVTGDMVQLAKDSPVYKVPYLVSGDRVLGDSCSILKFARESAGLDFFPDVDDYDLFCTANTVGDSVINLFLMERDGITPENSPYLGRQARRILSGLTSLDERVGPGGYALTDGILRTVCILDWALFRYRIDISPHTNLQAVLDFASRDPVVASTSIPEELR